MRIVFLIPSMRAGGAERVFANLLSLWDLSRDDVHLVLLKREGPLLEQIPSGVTVHELGTSRFWQAIPRLVALVRSLAPDALLSTQAHMNSALGILRPWWRVRRVVGRETNMPLQVERTKRSSPLRRAVYGWGYRGLDSVICLSQAMASEVADLYGVTKAVVISNPLRIDELRAEAAEALPPELDALAEGRWLVAVGRFSQQKGFDLLLVAMTELPADVRLCLIGDGPLRPPLEAQARTAGIAERVLFAGYQKNPHRLVARSRVFVLSSRYEGQPNAALEALVQGVPVVAFDGPWGAREVVTETTGILATPFDPHSLAVSIERALTVDWNVGGIRSWAEERFDGRRVAARYREVLE